MLVHLCDQRGLLHLDDPVAHYLPEFGQHGKDRITLRHVLTHRAGIPRIPPQFADVGLLERPKEILAILNGQRPTFAPGRRLAYHALTGGFVLAAIIERVTGKTVRELMRDEILAPLKFDAFNFGVPPARLHEVAVNAFTGPPLLRLAIVGVWVLTCPVADLLRHGELGALLARRRPAAGGGPEAGG